MGGHMGIVLGTSGQMCPTAGQFPLSGGELPVPVRVQVITGQRAEGSLYKEAGS